MGSHAAKGLNAASYSPFFLTDFLRARSSCPRAGWEQRARIHTRTPICPIIGRPLSARSLAAGPCTASALRAALFSRLSFRVMHAEGVEEVGACSKRVGARTPSSQPSSQPSNPAVSHTEGGARCVHCYLVVAVTAANIRRESACPKVRDERETRSQRAAIVRLS